MDIHAGLQACHRGAQRRTRLGECSRLSCDTVREGAAAAPQEALAAAFACLTAEEYRDGFTRSGGSCCRLSKGKRGGGFLAGLSMSLGRCEHPPCGGQCSAGPHISYPCASACLLVKPGTVKAAARVMLLRVFLGQRPPEQLAQKRNTAARLMWQLRRGLSVLSNVHIHSAS